MGYGRALLMRDVKAEEGSLQKKAAKKSLWGSIGRTVGGLGAMALTGGVVNPLTLGLITGAATFAGGAIGAKASGGRLTGGNFFKKDREALQKELGGFGTQNITSSLKSGLMAGIGQKLKLMKSGKEAAKLSEGFGLDFEGSFVGKSLEKGTAARHASKIAEADKLYGGVLGGGGESEFSNFQFSESAEGMRADIGRLRTPTSYGGGTDYTSNFPIGEGADLVRDQGLIGSVEKSTPFDRSSMLRRQSSARHIGGLGPSTGISGSGTDYTKTGAWEGVGQSFGVGSPDLFDNIGEGYSSSPSYDYQSIAGGRQKKLLDSLRWQQKLGLE